MFATFITEWGWGCQTAAERAQNVCAPLEAAPASNDSASPVLVWIGIIVLMLIVAVFVYAAIISPFRQDAQRRRLLEGIKNGTIKMDDGCDEHRGPPTIVHQYHMYAHNNPNDPFDHMRQP